MRFDGKMLRTLLWVEEPGLRSVIRLDKGQRRCGELAEWRRPNPAPSPPSRLPQLHAAALQVEESSCSCADGFDSLASVLPRTTHGLGQPTSSPRRRHPCPSRLLSSSKVSINNATRPRHWDPVARIAESRLLNFLLPVGGPQSLPCLPGIRSCRAPVPSPCRVMPSCPENLCRKPARCTN